MADLKEALEKTTPARLKAINESCELSKNRQSSVDVQRFETTHGHVCAVVGDKIDQNRADKYKGLWEEWHQTGPARKNQIFENCVSSEGTNPKANVGQFGVTNQEFCKEIGAWPRRNPAPPPLSPHLGGSGGKIILQLEIRGDAGEVMPPEAPQTDLPKVAGATAAGKRAGNILA